MNRREFLRNTSIFGAGLFINRFSVLRLQDVPHTPETEFQPITFEVPTAETKFYWPSLSPNNTQLAVALYDESTHTTYGISVGNLETGVSNPVHQTADRPVWSNDGTRLFANDKNNIITFKLDGTGSIDTIMENAVIPVVIPFAVDVRHPHELLNKDTKNLGSLSFVQKTEGKPDRIIRGEWFDLPLVSGQFFKTHEIEVQGIDSIDNFTWRPDGYVIVSSNGILYEVNPNGLKENQRPGKTPSVRPQGDAIAYVSEGKTIIAMKERETPLEIGPYFDPRWTFDGTSLVADDEEGNTYLVKNVGLALTNPQTALEFIQLTERRVTSPESQPGDLLG